MIFKTYSGVEIDADNIKPEDFNIIDIARGLSNMCRFSGQVNQFYSVAQHSLDVYEEIKDAAKYWNTPKYQEDAVFNTITTFNHIGWEEHTIKAAFLHDASEAYISDVATPFKCKMLDYQNIEDKIMRAIYARFNINPKLVNFDLIKHFDYVCYEYENTILKSNSTCVVGDLPNSAFSKFLQEGLKILK
jgi:hypothetical protein